MLQVDSSRQDLARAILFTTEQSNPANDLFNVTSNLVNTQTAFTKRQNQARNKICYPEPAIHQNRENETQTNLAKSV